MMTKEPAQFRRDMEEIDALISEALTHDFLSDKVYNQIIIKIGAFDDAFIKASFPNRDVHFLNWAKERLDKICKILIDTQAKADKKLTLRDEDLLHPTGDYFNEDNSIFLSPEIKDVLKKILNEHYREEIK